MDGYHSIIGSAWHQGDIYEVTAHLVPFLIACAAGTDTPSRGYLLAALVLIAASSSAPRNARARETTQAAVAASRSWVIELRDQSDDKALVEKARDLLLDLSDRPAQFEAMYSDDALMELAGSLETSIFLNISADE